MKFVCDRCQTRYNIADEKIRQRIVRIRCKNCGGVITLHAGEVLAGPQDNSARLSSDLPAVPAEVRTSSRLSRPPVPRSEWFVAVDGVEKGPLTCGEAAKYIVTFGPERVVHVWKEGMDEWKRPKDVAIIAQELSSLKRSPSEAAAGRAAASADATVVTPVPLTFDASTKPAAPKASGSAPKLSGLGVKPGSAPKGAPLPTLGSATKAAPGGTGSAPKHVPPAISGSGPKAAPSAATGSGPKAPPPIPAGHKAPPSIPGPGPRVTPIAAAHVVPEGRPAAKSSTHPVVRTPAPVTAPRTTPAAAAHGLPDARLFSQPSAHPPVKAPPRVTAPRSTPAAAAHVAPQGRPAAKSSTHPVVKTPPPVTAPRTSSTHPVVRTPPPVTTPRTSSTHPVVKTPPPAAVHQPEAARPGHETASASGAAEPTPGTEAGFDDDVPTSPRARQAAREDKDDPTPESTPAVDSTPGAQDFFQSEKTPRPSQALPSVASVHPIRESKNWPVANLSFAHPPVMPEGMSAEGAMALPTPAPLSGPLFANVADLPVKTLVGHAEVGLSKLTGLAGLVQKHGHLKYVAAAGVLVVLIIAVILLSWQGDNGKGVSKVAEIEKKARAAALAADPIPVPPEEPAPTALNVEPEPSKSHVSAAAHAGKRVSRPSAPTPAPAQNGKAAPVEDPFAAPAGMTRSAEKPIPLAAIQGKRPSAANEPRAVSQAQISEVVRKKENQAGLKTCYERALKRDGRLRTGRLDITVSIGAMGTVQRVQVNGSADFMVIDKCLKEAIRHWRFPASSEEYATSFPLILQGG